MKNINNIISNLVKEVSEKRGEIIDNFLEVYIASRKDWFLEKPDRLRRIKLVEQIVYRGVNGLKTTYHFEMMSGKKKCQIKSK